MIRPQRTGEVGLSRKDLSLITKWNKKIQESVLKEILVNVLDITIRLHVVWGRFDPISCLGEVILTSILEIMYKHTGGESLPTNVGETRNGERINFTTIWENVVSM